MADNVDSDVITEEFDTGGTATNVASPTTVTQSKEFSFGDVPVFESSTSTKDLPPSPTEVGNTMEIISPSKPSVPDKLSPATGDMVSLDNLNSVATAFSGGCLTFQDIVDETGLDKEVVLACLNWLRNYAGYTFSGKFYCSLDNVSAMVSQIRICKKCFGMDK